MVDYLPIIIILLIAASILIDCFQWLLYRLGHLSDPDEDTFAHAFTKSAGESKGNSNTEPLAIPDPTAPMAATPKSFGASNSVNNPALGSIKRRKHDPCPHLTKEVLIMRPGGYCEYTTAPPDGALEIPDSVVDFLSDQVWCWYDNQQQSPCPGLKGAAAYYILPDGSCRLTSQPPEGSIRVPDAVLEFLAGEILNELSGLLNPE
ncbi:hypothetical protein ABW19_dt0202758 [Dactylella cylindrospora]|nr:hypothetical protein ABW19_dt0202758 [Dactylella cylindrospora]